MLHTADTPAPADPAHSAQSADTPTGSGRDEVAMPTRLTAKYSADDRAKLARIIDWLNSDPPGATGYETRRTGAKLARAIGASNSTAQSVLSGTYPSPPAKHLNSMLAYIERDTARSKTAKALPFCETSVYKLVVMVCEAAHTGRDFGIVSGVVGVGKTTALKTYAARNPGQVDYLRITPDMNPVVMLQALVEMHGLSVRKQNRYGSGTKAEMLRAVIEHYRGRGCLLIADEAEKGHEANLEYLRTVSDEAGIGVVLAGTEKLRPMLEDERGRHGQISSRVGFWPRTIHHITREDSDLIAATALKTDDPDVLDACWQMCSARARVLEKLVRAIAKAQARKQRELNFDFVVACGQQLVGLDRNENPLAGGAL